MPEISDEQLEGLWELWAVSDQAINRPSTASNDNLKAAKEVIEEAECSLLSIGGLTAKQGSSTACRASLKAGSSARAALRKRTQAIQDDEKKSQDIAKLREAVIAVDETAKGAKARKVKIKCLEKVNNILGVKRKADETGMEDVESETKKAK